MVGLCELNPGVLAYGEAPLRSHRACRPDNQGDKHEALTK